MTKIQNLGFGLGLRTQHWDDVLRGKPKEVEWFEIISENFMHSHGHARNVLEKIRADYPIVMHGVSLSIGSADPLNHEYLHALKKLAEWLEPSWISDHICWTGINNVNTHDLLPVPYTQDALDNMIEKVQQTQEFLGQQILLENPSNYMEFTGNRFSEHEFVAELLKRADCYLLLDLNNVFVTCTNHGLDPKTYIDAMPEDKIGQIHLAGHADYDTHLIDTHNAPIKEEVLALYHYTTQTKGLKSTMVEWDSDIPEFSVLVEELNRVKAAAKKAGPLPHIKTYQKSDASNKTSHFDEQMRHFQQCVLERTPPEIWVRHNPAFPPETQMNIYQLAYRKQLFDTITEIYPQTRKMMGKDTFDPWVRTYIEEQPSQFYALDPYAAKFADYMAENHKDIAPMIRQESQMSLLRHQPQPECLKMEQLSQIAPEAFLKLNVKLTPAMKILEDEAWICQGLEVFKQRLTSIEHKALLALDESDSFEQAMHTLYEEGHFTAEAVLPELSSILVKFVREGFFTIHRDIFPY